MGGAGVVDPHGGVHELDAVGGARGEDGVELGGGERGGLLEEQVLPALRRRDGPARVEARGERHVHRVHGGVVEELLVGPHGAHRRGEGVLGDEAARLVEGAAPHGDEGGVGGEGDGAGHLARDLRAPHDAEANGARRRRRRLRLRLRHGFAVVGGEREGEGEEEGKMVSGVVCVSGVFANR